MPLWMYALGETLLEESDVAGTKIVVPYRNIIISLLVLVIPLVCGVGMLPFM